MLSPMSPPSKLLSLGEVLEVPSTSRKWKYEVTRKGLSLIVNTTETKVDIISYI